MLVGWRLAVSLYRRSRRTGCGIVGRLILYVGLGSKIMMMCALVMVSGWSQDFPWLPTWYIVHLIEDDWLLNMLHIQRCDDTLYSATLAHVSTSILGRWRCPCQVSYSLFYLRFIARNATVSDLLRVSILIMRAVYFFLISLGGP